MTAIVTRSKPLRSELVKLLTLRSVQITALVPVIVCIVMAGLTARGTGKAILSNDPNLALGIVPETVGFSWIGFGLIGIVVLGVMAGSSEYTSQQLKTSLLAVPGRLRLVFTKALALVAVTVGIGVLTIPTLSLISQSQLGSLSVIQHGIPESLIWRWVGGTAMWTATALIGFALGLLLRQTLIPLLIMIVVSQLTLALVHLVPFAQYLPFAAGIQLYDPAMLTGPTPGAALTPTVAAITLASWTLVLLAAAIIRFRQRDVQT